MCASSAPGSAPASRSGARPPPFTSETTQQIGGPVPTGFQGAIFDVDGVLVDSPHERAWRDALRELMQNEWRDIRDQSTWSDERFTPQVYQQVMSGKPRMAGALDALEFFNVPGARERVQTYA